MARKRVYTTVRTDSTENHIAMCLAKRDYDAVEAVKYFAHKAGIPISDDRIKAEAANICRVMKWEVPPHLQPIEPISQEPVKRPVGRPAKGTSWIETHRVTGKNGRVYEYKRQAWLENGRKRTKVIR